ncbi:aminotransferase class III-fold pyridoxal phosphate-dependent enzyme [Microbacterium imperiale]|uniref:aminotransferase class III-fold pyridoxal phosphate-dependent enzyme n=1 Tax=Microbacterium imperiale TaxID=33884 RepID=UPI001AE31420|nr:aminotransferase class III-fold pyridoxal phosphate-dependent enzyme [Microbacterium imperiale]MBP2421426.1 ornithine--oxo-acid transaminase [Microbacterium imperiale]MDS0199467.1 aminotransferase class III-fold pyridoxal phosphate-dependent enzyme [Microbacterium imperiale]
MTTADHDPRSATDRTIEQDRRHRAGRTPVLPVVVATGEGAWVTDIDGRRYLDLSSSTGALTFGHRHPALVAVAADQLTRSAFTSAAVHDDRQAGFAAALAELAGGDSVLSVDSGDEAMDVALRAAAARAQRDAAPASVVVAAGSHEPLVASGARTVPFGDAGALADALDDATAAVVLEPVQAGAGVVAAPAGYLAAARELCAERGVTLIVDETRSGLGRSGSTFAMGPGDGVPDIRLLGPALGGGIVPSAAVVGTRELLRDVSATASGSALAAAIGQRVVEMLGTGEIQTRAAALAEHLRGRLDALPGTGVTAVRTAGVWAGVDIDPAVGSATDIARRLVARGVLVESVGPATIVLSPPLVIRATELDWAIEQLRVVLAS